MHWKAVPLKQAFHTLNTVAFFAVSTMPYAALLLSPSEVAEELERKTSSWQREAYKAHSHVPEG